MRLPFSCDIHFRRQNKKCFIFFSIRLRPMYSGIGMLNLVHCMLYIVHIVLRTVYVFNAFTTLWFCQKSSESFISKWANQIPWSQPYESKRDSQWRISYFLMLELCIHFIAATKAHLRRYIMENSILFRKCSRFFAPHLITNNSHIIFASFLSSFGIEFHFNQKNTFEYSVKLRERAASIDV